MKIYEFAKLTVRSFPTLNELKNPFIYGDVQVIINVSSHAYPADVRAAIEAKGIKWFHFPLEEEVEDMGIQNILAAVNELSKAYTAGKRVVLHCQFGNNRSRTVAEAFYFKKTGLQFDDEYKGKKNHLIYNCESHHLPPLTEVEQFLRRI